MFTVCTYCETGLSKKEKRKSKGKKRRICEDCKDELSKRLPL